jgi:hypothetical protein
MLRLSIRAAVVRYGGFTFFDLILIWSRGLAEDTEAKAPNQANIRSDFLTSIPRPLTFSK